MGGSKSGVVPGDDIQFHHATTTYGRRRHTALWQDPAFLEDKADAVLVTTLDVDIGSGLNLVKQAIVVDVSMPETSLASMDKATRQAGETRSKVLVEAALMRMDRHQPT